MANPSLEEGNIHAKNLPKHRIFGVPADIGINAARPYFRTGSSGWCAAKQ